ncbi:MAG: tRNA (adenosine(37)-N6)-threonylcarbamoyltransferase complex ATPase subunit type 1 TsaE [Candidatus Pacebacteria bacterium]|nr:tRNA (adenosine(37)-N6)-threonylcarbamoyltransferase complex ATPase subunit type 1 TsaE [Candidatus Paceibacterota bacterium]MBP9842957.1 tRNA (adenosine(37)-N6)-threonylcarbamoyltransferase complex ATPase subunit type 1 TsaE [Candidatus Paceibacterota bacterium]
MLEGEQIIAKENLKTFAEEVLAECRALASNGAVVIALQGDLGAGKTTFVQALGKALGITEQITSPTFTIMKGYETTDVDFEHLIHMDAYRIDELSELGPLRFSDILNTPQTLFCIEWAEKIAEALPAKVLHISLTIASENTRTVHISHS